jgi:hypothetical protein
MLSKRERPIGLWPHTVNGVDGFAHRSVRATRVVEAPLKPTAGLNGAPGCSSAERLRFQSFMLQGFDVE